MPVSAGRRGGGPQPGFALFRTGRDGSVGQKVSQVHRGRSGCVAAAGAGPSGRGWKKHAHVAISMYYRTNLKIAGTPKTHFEKAVS